MLHEAGKHYGDNIIKEYSKKLTKEIGIKYSVRYLFDMRKLYLFSKVHPVDAQLTMSHYRLLFPLKNTFAINYYINQTIKRNLGKRELAFIIKNDEYERLSEETKYKLKTEKEVLIKDLIKNPIIIKNKHKNEITTEKVLQKLILEDIPSFLKELGTGFSFIENEYKIKIGNSYNYIDILLYNIKYKCYVVVELKVTELKKEHIGQIETYMNYIEKNMRTPTDEKTIGIIIVKKNNKYIMEYCTDPRIVAKSYKLISNYE